MRARFVAPLAAVAAALALAGTLVAAHRPAAAQTLSPPAAPSPPSAPAAPSFAADAAGAEADEVLGEIAVDVRDDASEADVQDLAARYGLALHPNSGWSRAHDKIEVADVDPAREEALLDALAHDARVESAEPMALYREMFVPDDPLYASKQWHLRRVGAERAWNYSCGQGVTVAVVDTGIACFDRGPFSRGTDLAGTRCRGGYNFVDNSAEPYDDQGHGTHVAGTIAQTTNNAVGTAGLAYCATLMPVKVLTRQGFGTVANVAEGIRFAAAEGAQVINLSLGGPFKSRLLEAAVDDALAQGVVVVAAAGNSGGRVGYPAAYPGVVAVSATDANDRIAGFSSRGPEIAIAAPGVGITQQTVCNGGRDKCEIFGTFNGTSMAAPHVAGIAALIESLGVTRGSAVRDALTESARPQEDSALYGAGIVDAGAAAARVFWHHAALRVLALLGLGWIVRRRIRARGGVMTRRVSAWVGAAIAGTGLAPFAPFFGVGAGTGRLAMAAGLAMRPLGEWDFVLLGAESHRWLVLASALPAVALSALAFSSARARPFIGGVALGSAALLVQMAWSADVTFVGGAALSWVWVVTNGLVCMWIARTGLGERRFTPEKS